MFQNIRFCEIIGKILCGMTNIMLRLRRFSQNSHPVWTKMMAILFDVESQHL
jgi:hypothetical protein